MQEDYKVRCEIKPTTQEERMDKHCSRPFVVVCFATALLLSAVSMCFAQIDEARGQYYNKIMGLVTDVSNDIRGGNVKRAYERIDEIEKVYPYERDQFERIGERLHDTDKKWLEETSKYNTLRALSNFGVQMGVLKMKLKSMEDTSSELSNFLSAWQEFVKMFDEFYKEYTTRFKEMDERAKKYHEDCKGCS